MSASRGPEPPGRRPDDPNDPDDRDDPKRPQPGRIRTTPPGALVGLGLAGLVAGWLLRRVTVAVRGYAPTVPWLQVVVLFFVGAVVTGAAYLTWRQLQRRHEPMEPHRAVNRLVMGKASALVGAVAAGGYFGYALSFLGLTRSPLARERVLHSVLAGVAGLLLMVGALLLERACRTDSEDDRDLR